MTEEITERNDAGRVEYVEEVEEQPKPESQSGEMVERRGSLLNRDEMEDWKERWNSILTGFVDDPHDSVKKADKLIAGVVQSINDAFIHEREMIEHQWDDQDGNTSTEDLRVALQHYRSFFNHLLEI